MMHTLDTSAVMLRRASVYVYGVIHERIGLTRKILLYRLRRSAHK